MGKIVMKILGIILVALQLIASGIFCGFLYVSNFLTLDWLMIVALVLLILVLVNLIMQRWLIPGILGDLIAIALIGALGYGCYMLMSTTETLDIITSTGKTQVDELSVYVLEDDPAETLADASDYSYGILSTMDRENSDYAVQSIETDLGASIDVHEYDDLTALASGLENQEVEAIILNSGFLDVIGDMEGYESFPSDVRLLYTVDKETQIISAEETLPTDIITSTPFMVYVSGCDQSGDISTKGRSDVNIIMAVNPNTKQVLLVSTPRDFYVPLSISNGVEDKLTHAGIYGVDVSMDTLSMLYDTDISLYFKCNFTGFKEIIDALGGVTVESDVAFTAGADAASKSSESTYQFFVGDNQLDGDAALAFARERHAFAIGDRQRGENQMKVIKAVIEKLQSSKLLTKYSKIMKSISGSFDTNMTTNQIAALVQMQLDDMAEWEVFTYSVTGSDSKNYTYSSPSSMAYVMVPDTSTIELAERLLNKIENGELITEENLDGEFEEDSTESDTTEETEESEESAETEETGTEETGTEQ